MREVRIGAPLNERVAGLRRLLGNVDHAAVFNLAATDLRIAVHKRERKNLRAPFCDNGRIVVEDSGARDFGVSALDIPTSEVVSLVGRRFELPDLIPLFERSFLGLLSVSRINRDRDVFEGFSPACVQCRGLGNRRVEVESSTPIIAALTVLGVPAHERIVIFARIVGLRCRGVGAHEQRSAQVVIAQAVLEVHMDADLILEIELHVRSDGRADKAKSVSGTGRARPAILLRAPAECDGIILRKLDRVRNRHGLAVIYRLGLRKFVLALAADIELHRVLNGLPDRLEGDVARDRGIEVVVVIVEGPIGERVAGKRGKFISSRLGCLFTIFDLLSASATHAAVGIERHRKGLFLELGMQLDGICRCDFGSKVVLGAPVGTLLGVPAQKLIALFCGFGRRLGHLIADLNLIGHPERAVNVIADVAVLFLLLFGPNRFERRIGIERRGAQNGGP